MKKPNKKKFSAVLRNLNSRRKKTIANCIVFINTRDIFFTEKERRKNFFSPTISTIYAKRFVHIPNLYLSKFLLRPINVISAVGADAVKIRGSRLSSMFTLSILE